MRRTPRTLSLLLLWPAATLPMGVPVELCWSTMWSVCHPRGLSCITPKLLTAMPHEPPMTLLPSPPAAPSPPSSRCPALTLNYPCAMYPDQTTNNGPSSVRGSGTGDRPQQ